MTDPGTEAAEPAPVPRSQRSFPALDGVRAVAALGVVVTHVAFRTGAYGGGVAGGVLARLDAAVAVFFVVSGFLLLRPWVAAAATSTAPPRAAAYLWRRALRVLPAYWALLALAALLVPRSHDTSAGNWVRHVLLVQVYVDGWPVEGLTHTWSLCTEVAFYLLVPLLGAALVRGTGSTARREAVLATALVLVGAASTVLVRTVPGVPQSAGTWLLPHADWFAGGLALAVAQVHLARRADGGRWRALRAVAAAPGSCWCAALALLVVASTPVAGPRGPEPLPPAAALVRELLLLAVALLVVLPVVLPSSRPSLLLAVLTSPPLRRAGELSYGVFLYHLVVVDVLARALGLPPFGGSTTGLLLLTLAVTWVMAQISWRFLEGPALQLRDRVPATAPRPAPAPAGPRP